MKLNDMQGPEAKWNKEGRQEPSQQVRSIQRGFRGDASHREDLKNELTRFLREKYNIGKGTEV